MRDDPHGAGTGDRPREVLRIRPFALFWSATTLRSFGGAIAGVAFQVLIVTIVAILGFPLLGLAIAGLYATVTLAAAIEHLRLQP